MSLVKILSKYLIFSPKAALNLHFPYLLPHTTQETRHNESSTEGKCSTSFHASFSEIRPWFIPSQAEGHLILICQNSQNHVYISWVPPTPFWDDNLLIMEERPPSKADSSRGHRIINPSQMGVLQNHIVSPPHTDTHTRSWVIAGCLWLRDVHLQWVFFEELTTQSHIRGEEANVKSDKHTNQAVSD